MPLSQEQKALNLLGDDGCITMEPKLAAIATDITSILSRLLHDLLRNPNEYRLVAGERWIETTFPELRGRYITWHSEDYIRRVLRMQMPRVCSRHPFSTVDPDVKECPHCDKQLLSYIRTRNIKRRDGIAIGLDYELFARFVASDRSQEILRGLREENEGPENVAADIDQSEFLLQSGRQIKIQPILSRDLGLLESIYLRQLDVFLQGSPFKFGGRKWWPFSRQNWMKCVSPWIRDLKTVTRAFKGDKLGAGKTGRGFGLVMTRQPEAGDRTSNNDGCYYAIDRSAWADYSDRSILAQYAAEWFSWNSEERSLFDQRPRGILYVMQGQSARYDEEGSEGGEGISSGTQGESARNLGAFGPVPQGKARATQGQSARNEDGSDNHIARAMPSGTGPNALGLRALSPEVARAMPSGTGPNALGLRALSPEVARAMPSGTGPNALGLRALSPEVARALPSGTGPNASGLRAQCPGVAAPHHVLTNTNSEQTPTDSVGVVVLGKSWTRPQLIELLTDAGIKPPETARSMVSKYPAERIVTFVDYARWEDARGKCENLGGFIFKGLKKNWQVSEEFLSARDAQLKAAAEKTAAEAKTLADARKDEEERQKQKRVDAAIDAMTDGDLAGYVGQVLKKYDGNSAVLSVIAGKQPRDCRLLRMEIGHLLQQDGRL
jgi:hypothetical protein